ncbi:methyltransferase domain-containing protein [Marinobacter nanhaiticus]|nr:class I SAM-dependent methyltransferase [Marinobacter nanhaiticus]
MTRSPQAEVYQMLDLGCGTGSNMRYLAPRLPGGQAWTLVDHDPGHLEAADRLCKELPGVSSFATRLQRLEEGLGVAIPDETDVVTGSALLDLVSGDWLENLAARADEISAAVLFTLSYSGDFLLSPMLEDDGWILRAVNEHQRSEKGSGRALGPDAWFQCAQAFEPRGYHVFSAPSAWVLGEPLRNLQVQLFEGWAEAAAEQRPNEAGRADAWLTQRLKLLDDVASETRVFHQDVLALPDDAATSPVKDGARPV